MPRLIFRKGDRVLLEFKLPQGRTLVGRADNCDLVVPGDTISRTHCVITCRGDRISVRDRSRHGVTHNGARLDGGAELSDGDVLGLGDFLLQLSTAERNDAAQTASAGANLLPAEQIVTTEDGLLVQRLVLVVDSGPCEGQRKLITRPRQSVGSSAAAEVRLSDPSLLPHHFTLLVVRGRAMIHPGEGAAFLDGERLVATTPVYHGEPVTIGDTVFHLEAQVDRDSADAKRFGQMVGVSEASRRAFGMLRRVAAHNAPVLVLGESGTGKELAARGLHDESPRAGQPFVAVNCGAIAEQLFESELFGHEKGAFTGADRRTDGAFHRADGGTLFLDEIGELPEAAQVKLLRTLESGEVRRVGSFDVSYPDARVIAATNRDLAERVQAGKFRADLYFRLAVLAVRLPPLRERPDDLAPIAEALCRQLGAEVTLTKEALDVLRGHEFPGNARELRNVLTRAYVLGGARIDARDVSFTPWSFELGAARSEQSEGSRLESTERTLLMEALRRHEGNRSAAARDLGIARSTLHYKIRRYELES